MNEKKRNQERRTRKRKTTIRETRNIVFILVCTDEETKNKLRGAHTSHVMPVYMQNKSNDNTAITIDGTLNLMFPNGDAIYFRHTSIIIHERRKQKFVV